MDEKDGYSNSPFTEPLELEITDCLDLHAFAPRDVKAVVTAYLTEARAMKFRYVRIIHGNGIGVQRELVRSILRKTAFVKAYKSGDEFSGGSGATCIEFTQQHES